MNEAARQARNAYKRKWNRENRDKVKKYQQDYWNRKAQAMAAAEAEEAKAAGDPAGAMQREG